GVVMISPSATSPALTTAEDDGLFFRTSPSDARQGEVMANVISERGIGEVAISYVNADYGKGLADSFQSAFEAIGGKVTLSSPHEDGKADYSAEVGALASAGGEALVVAGYADSGGKGIIQASLDTGAFDVFVLPDGMVADSLLEAFGTALDGSFGQVPGSDNPGAAALMPMLEAIDVNPSAPFVAESYDAAALLMLAVEAAGSSDSQAIKDNVIAVANAPGEAILPGQLGMAIEILAGGGEVDYQGGTGVELIGPGEAAGSYRLFEIQEGQFSTLGYR
ncbi:MAG: ABC transporter substrate-binding protein, partial [Rhodobacteraceae bacterium]|nr:ABC transporter substrate-binding protein [Paracoccaceae bacterium]